MPNVHTTTVLVSAKSTHCHRQMRNRPRSKRKTLLHYMTLRLPVAMYMTTKHITLSVSKLHNTGTSMSAHHLRSVAGHWPHHGQQVLEWFLGARGNRPSYALNLVLVQAKGSLMLPLLSLCVSCLVLYISSLRRPRRAMPS